MGKFVIFIIYLAMCITIATMSLSAIKKKGDKGKALLYEFVRLLFTAICLTIVLGFCAFFIELAVNLLDYLVSAVIILMTIYVYVIINNMLKDYTEKVFNLQKGGK